MTARDDRAARRRGEWTAEIVEAGRPKGRLHADASVMQRLCALVDLSERAWIASGKPLPPATSRAQWPSEIFESPRRG